jgi:hypothetical protein
MEATAMHTVSNLPTARLHERLFVFIGALPKGGLQGPPRLRRPTQGVSQLGDLLQGPRPPLHRGRNSSHYDCVMSRVKRQ